MRVEFQFIGGPLDGIKRLAPVSRFPVVEVDMESGMIQESKSVEAGAPRYHLIEIRSPHGDEDLWHEVYIYSESLEFIHRE